MIILFHLKIWLGNFNTWFKIIVWAGFLVSSFLTVTNVTSTFFCYKNLSWNLSVVFRIVSECVGMRYEGRRECWANVTATRPAVAASLVDQGMGGGDSGSRSSPQPLHAAPPPLALPLKHRKTCWLHDTKLYSLVRIEIIHSQSSQIPCQWPHFKSFPPHTT